MAGLLGVALSGLKVANRALETVGHNIANVNTPGYSGHFFELRHDQIFILLDLMSAKTK